MEIISFFSGILLHYTHAWLLILLLIAVIWLGASYYCLILFLLGFFSSVLHDEGLMNHQEDAPSFKERSLVGIVSSIPKINDFKTQFKFQIDKPFSEAIWLSCYRHCPIIRVGETWSFLVNLKKMNKRGPHEQQIKNWMLYNHLSSFGTFSVNQAIKYKDADWRWIIQTLRAFLANKLETHLKKDKSLGIIQGLTLGLGQNIPKEQWDLFRRTGTTHLVVISGEHISLVAGSFFILINYLWKRAGSLALFLPSQRAAALKAWLIACFYAYLAGLGAPVERAMIAFGLVLLCYFFPLRFSKWQIWRYTLFLVTLLEPHVVLNPGFYLSFIAVAVLFLTSERFPTDNKFKQLMLIQSFCLVGLLPLTLYFFSYGALNSLLINLIAIPFVGWIIVPCSLIGLMMLIFHPCSIWLWPAKEATHILLNILAYFDKTSWINLDNIELNTKGLIACSLCVALFFLFPVRKLMLIYVLIVIAGMS